MRLALRLEHGSFVLRVKEVCWHRSVLSEKKGLCSRTTDVKVSCVGGHETVLRHETVHEDTVVC